jgi:molybdopterin converting factor small subunit
MRVKLTCRRQSRWIDLVEGTEATVAGALDAARAQASDACAQWIDANGETRQGLIVLVNKEHIRYRDGMDTTLSDGDEVYIIPPIVGG